MRIAGLALGCFFVAFLLHWVVWRIKIPRRQTFALLLILLGTLPLGLGLMLLPPGSALVGSLSWWEILQIAIFHVALSLAYIVAYSALEGRSPSMTLLVYVADAGSGGRTREELESLLWDERPVESRLDAMLRDGMVSQSNDICRLTAKGWAWARCFAAQRAFLGMEKGG